MEIVVMLVWRLQEKNVNVTYTIEAVCSYICLEKC